ncbi:hypothetical protein POTOM_041205 [Populus tomentosa]|uniref:Uncharacterized protein n=1 Tax=Populus tomentosa TaxID=118781 RepID=A0A8X7YQG2_POPTO|nr:hypothetical protein POTOM_041205 [Populus tomentosa]
MHREADAILESIISERRANSALTSKMGKNEEDDLLGVLLNLQDHGNLEFQLTTSSIKAIILPEDLDMTESFGSSSKRKQDLMLIRISYRSLVG